MSGYNNRNKFTITDGMVNVVMILLIFLTVYPIYYIFINSISGSAAVASKTVLFYPRDINFQAYRVVLKDASIVRSFSNSVFYTIAGTAINVALTAMCAYPLSRKDLFGRKIFVGIIMFTMFFSGGIIPLFLTVSNLQLYDSIWAVLLPSAVSVYNVIVMRTFFNGIPYELTESSYMDGANDIYIFTRIILPLSLPIIATMVLFYGVGNWNSFYNALMFLSEKNKYPVQLVLRSIVLDGATSDLSFSMGSENASSANIDTRSIKYAVIAVTTIPIMAVYPFVFKYFEKGVMIGSVKG